MRFPVPFIEVPKVPNSELEDQERDDNALFLSLQVRSLICFLNEVQYFWETKDASHVVGSYEGAKEHIKQIRAHIGALDKINSETFQASWTCAGDLVALKHSSFNQQYADVFHKANS